MLHLLTFISIFSIGYVASASVDQSKIPCRTSSYKELVRENRCYQNTPSQDRFLEQFQKQPLQKVEALQEDPLFQETVKVLQNNSSLPQNTALNPGGETKVKPNDSLLYIFVSFSMGEKALLNLAYEAKQFGATLVLRGFKEGSYRKTAQALMKIIQETGQGVLVDPELYTLFDIKAVPTFLLAKPFQLSAQERTQTPIHDKLQGYVSTHYVLEQFAKEGDLKEEAHLLLLQGGMIP